MEGRVFVYPMLRIGTLESLNPFFVDLDELVAISHYFESGNLNVNSSTSPTIGLTSF